MKTVFALLIASVFVVSVSHAQTISYQGTIAKSDGSPAEGTHRIGVSLWTASDTGSLIWTDEFVTQLTNGVFNLQLGSGKPLPKSPDMDKPLWVTVAINGQESNSYARLS